MRDSSELHFLRCRYGIMPHTRAGGKPKDTRVAEFDRNNDRQAGAAL